MGGHFPLYCLKEAPKKFRHIWHFWEEKCQKRLLQGVGGLVGEGGHGSRISGALISLTHRRAQSLRLKLSLRARPPTLFFEFSAQHEQCFAPFPFVHLEYMT